MSTRQVGGSDEIQVRIDPMHGDLDNEITGLRKQVKQLRNVCLPITLSLTLYFSILYFLLEDIFFA